MIRPAFMRIEEARCLVCDLCHTIAPEIRLDPQRIPATSRSLDAMAECPTGAIVWTEEPDRDPKP